MTEVGVSIKQSVARRGSGINQIGEFHLISKCECI